jgi:hypothetical protein
MMAINLFEMVTREDITLFANAVINLACKDFKKGFHKDWKSNNLRSGEEILANLDIDIASLRRFHRRMASSIYANTIWTLRASQGVADQRLGDTNTNYKEEA